MECLFFLTPVFWKFLDATIISTSVRFLLSKTPASWTLCVRRQALNSLSLTSSFPPPCLYAKCGDISSPLSQLFDWISLYSFIRVQSCFSEGSFFLKVAFPSCFTDWIFHLCEAINYVFCFRLQHVSSLCIVFVSSELYGFLPACADFWFGCGGSPVTGEGKASHCPQCPGYECPVFTTGGPILFCAAIPSFGGSQV